MFGDTQWKNDVSNVKNVQHVETLVTIELQIVEYLEINFGDT